MSEDEGSARLTHRSRARITPISSREVNSGGILPGPLGDIFRYGGDTVNALSPFVVEQWFRHYPDDGFESVTALGLDVGLKASKIRELLGFSRGGSIQSGLGDYLPGLSVGALVAIGENDDLTKFTAAITTPQALTDFFDRWANGRTG